MVPFDPIAVAHREMTKMQKEQDKILQGLQDTEKNKEDQDDYPSEETQDEVITTASDMDDIAKHMIHSINIE